MLKISAQMKISSSPRTCHNVTQLVKKKHAYAHSFSSPKQCQFGHLQPGFLFVFIYSFIFTYHALNLQYLLWNNTEDERNQ